MNYLIEKLVANNILSETELLLLLEAEDLFDDIKTSADNIRKNNVGDEIHLRGLIEFSNICSNNCLYCGLRYANKQIDRYNATPDEIITLAQKAKSLGINTIVLQSGENNCYKLDTMQEIITQIKELDIAITLSIGEKSYEEYKAYKLAGADRYLLRIETTDKDLYKKMHPNMDLNNRIRCLNDLKELNYEVGSGIIVGLPEQSLSSIAKDLLFLKDLGIDMAGIGPFIPSPNTPLENVITNKNFELSIKVMALMRLLLPKINIPATTAMETLKENGKLIALQSGANVIMPNITTESYKVKYSIYPNKANGLNKIEDNLKEIEKNVISIDRSISNHYGTSLAWKEKQL